MTNTSPTVIDGFQIPDNAADTREWYSSAADTAAMYAEDDDSHQARNARRELSAARQAMELLDLPSKADLFTEWYDAYRARTTRFAVPGIAARWIKLGVSAVDAASWARLGYLPSEAAPLIADGVTPQSAREKG